MLLNLHIATSSPSSHKSHDQAATDLMNPSYCLLRLCDEYLPSGRDFDEICRREIDKHSRRLHISPLTSFFKGLLCPYNRQQIWLTVIMRVHNSAYECVSAMAQHEAKLKFLSLHHSMRSWCCWAFNQYSLSDLHEVSLQLQGWCHTKWHNDGFPPCRSHALQYPLLAHSCLMNSW